LRPPSTPLSFVSLSLPSYRTPFGTERAFQRYGSPSFISSETSPPFFFFIYIGERVCCPYVYAVRFSPSPPVSAINGFLRPLVLGSQNFFEVTSFTLFDCRLGGSVMGATFPLLRPPPPSPVSPFPYAEQQHSSPRLPEVFEDPPTFNGIACIAPQIPQGITGEGRFPFVTWSVLDLPPLSAIPKS